MKARRENENMILDEIEDKLDAIAHPITHRKRTRKEEEEDDEEEGRFFAHI